MPNEYKSFYFADLKAMVRETAMDTMLPPDIMADEIDTLRSAMIAVYNDGIKTLTEALIEKLAEEAKG